MNWPVFGVDEIEAVTRILQSGKVNYWTGDEGRQFEQEFAAHCGVAHAIAVANGTVALELALRAAGIGAGDDVITTPRTFIASASCAVAIGARPVFADIDPESQNISAATIEAALTPATRAIVAVHHAGWPCEMDEIMALARSRGLVVIEDCAQAHGATYRGRPVGSLGDIAAFSFCQDKIMTLGGEGGMIVTDNSDYWRRAWSLKDHGKDHDLVYSKNPEPGFRWLHADFGTNARMTEMQSAIGRIQLRKLPEWHAARRNNATALAGILGQVPDLHIPAVPKHVEHAWYRFYAFIAGDDDAASGVRRDKAIAAMEQHGHRVFVGSCPEIYREQAFVRHGLVPARRLPVAQSLGPRSLAFLVDPVQPPAKLTALASNLRDYFGGAT